MEQKDWEKLNKEVAGVESRIRFLRTLMESTDLQGKLFAHQLAHFKTRFEEIIIEAMEVAEKMKP